MAQSVEMPALGESVTEGTVTKWLKNVGDTVAVDEPLLEVSTDKVDTEIPSPIAGTLINILVPEDETVDVGTVVCKIGEASELNAASNPDNPVSETIVEIPNPEIPSTVIPVENGTQVEWSYPQVPPLPPKAENVEPPSLAETPSDSPIKMPALGESVTEGTVTKWLKNVGDTVAVDEPLLEVSTDKVDTEIPSPIAGVISRILVGEDDTVNVGAVLAYVAGKESYVSASESSVAPDQALPADPIPAAPEVRSVPSVPEVSVIPTPPPLPIPPAVVKPQMPTPSVSSNPISSAPTTPPAAAKLPTSSDGNYATPIVRKLAREKGVDLNQIHGSGVGGRIRKQDVLAAAKTSAALPLPPANTVSIPPALPSPLRGSRTSVPQPQAANAARIVESQQITAQQTSVIEVDVTRIVALLARARDSFSAREGAELRFLTFVIKSTVEALKSHPALNASLEGTEIVYHGEENIGLLSDTIPDSLLIIGSAGDLTIAGIAKQLAAKQLADSATFTITDSGTAGFLMETPIINQPNAAALSIGKVSKRPAVFSDAEGNDTFAIRSTCYLSLSYDHRVVNSAEAAKFLMTVKARLESGEFANELGL